ncbi:MAG: hypothetical protein ABW149_17400, partial [Sedimenticola sp.]
AGMHRSGDVQDVRYAAGAGMHRSGDVQDVRAGNCSMHYLHFRHPWRSYAAGARLQGCRR